MLVQVLVHPGGERDLERRGARAGGVRNNTKNTATLGDRGPVSVSGQCGCFYWTAGGLETEGVGVAQCFFVMKRGIF